MEIRDVTARVSDDIATVVEVRWTTDEPTTGHIEYGTGETLDRKTPPTEQGTEHRRVLLGLRADTPYRFRVVSEDQGESVSGEIQMIRTDPLPVNLPRLTQSGSGHDGFIIAPILGTQTAVLIIDEAGEIVWYHIDDSGLDVYRARLSRDGESVVYNAASVSGDPSEESRLVRVALDGSRVDSLPVSLLAHDFVELPDGTLSAIVFETREVDGEPVLGNQLVEVGADGEPRTVWSTWDCFDPQNPRQEGDTPELGWTFANALDYDAEDDAYLVGLRSLSSIAKVDRESGDCEWVLGLFGSTIDIAAEDPAFLHQHQFDLRDNHLVVFDNEGSAGSESRVIAYEIDFDAGTASAQWTYVTEPSVYSFVLGEATWLSDGEVFVNWSNGLMERLDDQQQATWRLESPAGAYFGFQTLAASLYAGTEAP